MGLVGGRAGGCCPVIKTLLCSMTLTVSNDVGIYLAHHKQFISDHQIRVELIVAATDDRVSEFHL